MECKKQAKNEDEELNASTKGINITQLQSFIQLANLKYSLTIRLFWVNTDVFHFSLLVLIFWHYSNHR